MQPRDSQRSKWWGAVRKHSLWNSETMSFEDVVSFTDKVTSKVWWKNRTKKTDWFHRRLRKKIEVKDGRRRSYCTGYSGRIKVPVSDRRKMLVLWCIAQATHNTSEWAFHGEQFSRLYLELVGVVLGKEAYEELRDLYREHKVRFNQRRSRPDLKGKRLPWQRSETVASGEMLAESILSLRNEEGSP